VQSSFFFFSQENPKIATIECNTINSSWEMSEIMRNELQNTPIIYCFIKHTLERKPNQKNKYTVLYVKLNI
jgi:hypothetical protein